MPMQIPNKARPTSNAMDSPAALTSNMDTAAAAVAMAENATTATSPCTTISVRNRHARRPRLRGTVDA